VKHLRRKPLAADRRASRRFFSAVVAVLVSLVTASVTPTAMAQGNYRLAPVGGRTTLVGGTGLAFGRDSASAFLNPATIVRVDAGRLAFSVNFYSVSVVTAERWYQPGPVDRARFGEVQTDDASITNADFDALPGSLCLFFRMADIPLLARATSKDLRERQARLGLCLATVQSSNYAFNAEDYARSGPFGRTRQAGSIRQTFRRFAVGPSYAMYVDDHLALGASLHFSRASFRSFIDNSTTTFGPGPAPINSGYFATSRGDSHELNATLGATYRMGNQTVAISVEAPSLHLFGSGGLHNYTHYDGHSAGAATANTAAAGSFTAQTPLRVGIGTGYEAAWGSAELNVSFHVPVGGAYEAKLAGRAYESGPAGTVDRPVSLDLLARSRGVVNIGVGGEVFLTPRVSFLGGVSTDLSSVPNGALGKDPMSYYPANTDRIAASFGYGSHGEGGDLLIGGELSYGWGERLAVNPYQLPSRLETTDERTYALLLVIAGSTSFKNIRRAVDDVTRSVDPRGGPKKPRETEKMKTDRQTDDPNAPKQAEPVHPDDAARDAPPAGDPPPPNVDPPVRPRLVPGAKP
jgi:hypothetical protein